MTRHRLLTFTFVALAALLAALWLRRRPVGIVEVAPPEQVVAEAPATPISQVEPVAASTVVEAPSPKAEGPLHGLRLLPESVALLRGWAPPPPDLRLLKSLEVAARLEMTLFTLNYNETTLVDVARDLGDRYNVEIKLDPEVSGEHKTVTFRVDELKADQALDLILKMADLAYRVDEKGIIWIVTKESVTDTNPVWREVSAVQSKMVARKPIDERMAEWLAGHTASVAFEDMSVDIAIKVLLDEGGLPKRSWSGEAAHVAAVSAPVSLTGSDLHVGLAIESLLRPIGLTLAWGYGGPMIMTREEYDELVAEEKEVARIRAEDDADLEAILRRRVRIEGECLSLKYIAAQISAQLGEVVRVDPHFDDRNLRWESDDLEQSVGEVLGILGRDAGLNWRYTEPLSLQKEEEEEEEEEAPPDLPSTVEDPPKELWLLMKDR